MKQKLELTWVNKDVRPRLEPRVLLPDETKSYVAEHRVTEQDIFDNKLIFGDNLLALKALEQELTGKVKCVFIDPPYNTGSAFENYDDGLEHSLWLGMIRNRLELLRTMLKHDGSIWISLDDGEAHYLKVLCDEVFGRNCFIADIAWQKRDGPPNDRKIGSIHDHIIVYGKEKSISSKKTYAEEAFNLMPRTEKADAQYQVFTEPDGPDPRGPFRKIDTTANAKGGRYVESLYYPLTNPYTGEEVYPRKGTCWRHSKEEMARLQADKRLFWGANGTAKTPMRKLFKSEAKQGMTTPSIWFDAGLNQHASAEMEDLFGEKAAFETPKPEQLLERIIHIATNPGDLVLDSFAGSGTTGAVAHKIGRRWIMIEVEPATPEKLIIPRLRKVIDGTDVGGISESVGWKGGGGFRYYKLAPSVLAKDKWDNWVVNPSFNAEMLSEAMCKLEGFTYAPSDSVYWLHGYSTERDFIYVTTQHLSSEQLQSISDDVGSERTLLILCSAYRASEEMFSNLTIKKIPQAVLHKCEWGKDDYSLKVENLPKAPEPQPEPEAVLAKLKTNRNQASLFDGGND